MQILIIAVGKDTLKDLSTIQADYEQRLKPYTSLAWKLLPASKLRDSAMIRANESEQIEAALKPTDTLILLDERGDQLTNEQFAIKYEQLSGSHGRTVFVIGGAYGVSESVRQRATFVWSFSKLVFPHQLMRVMLLEQIYRTYMVQKGHPYHHGK